MRSALIVMTAIFMRRFAVLAVTAAILGGCYATRPVTAPTAGADVRIQYGDPRPALTVLTIKHGLVVLPRVRSLDVRIVAIRAESVEVRVFGTDSGDNRVYGGTIIIAHPSDSSRPQKWTRQKFSLGRTSALILIPAGTLAIGIATSCWC